MSLPNQRRSIQHLLDPREAVDAQSRYYAFQHPDNRTTLITYPAGQTRPTGYLCLSRTGYDLFCPLVTMRLPDEINDGYGLINQAIPAESTVIFSTPPQYNPLIGALFDIDSQQTMRTLVLDRGRYEPLINIYVVRSAGPNGLARAVIRKNGSAVASAGINWETGGFAEINVETSAAARGQGYGKSVVSALCHWIMESGKKPIYMVADDNNASLQLAEQVGFVDIGIRTSFIRATRRAS